MEEATRPSWRQAVWGLIVVVGLAVLICAGGLWPLVNRARMTAQSMTSR